MEKTREQLEEEVQFLKQHVECAVWNVKAGDERRQVTNRVTLGPLTMDNPSGR